MTKYLQLLLITLLFLLSSLIVAHASFLPFGRMYKAAKDDRTYKTQAQDSRLQLQLHKTILLSMPSELLSISTYVYLGHGFIVGEVQTEEQSRELVAAAGKLDGINGVSYYLPIKSKQDQTATSSALEIKINAIFEPDYPSSKLTVKVVQDVVVVLGVLTSDEQQNTLNSLKKISGADKVINFIQTPSSEETKRNRPKPLRNLFN
ncbi:BON domain-containing protein [Maridesulfovibrio frigidus]|uniref:hypothetical protein n=1 Tax=Maridesulfovibrio frigidus TaxID=340956 RepID=UPI0004E27DC5|nr:hypothetical protein [Maridesulfovibrio frigidus]